MPPSIWWVRRDLRLDDNHALHSATAAGTPVIPIFILDPTLLNSPWVGEKRTAFLFDGLRALDQGLRRIGSRLIVRQGDPKQVLQHLLSESGAQNIYAERDVSPYAQTRDQRIAATLPLNLTPGVSIRPLGSVHKDDGAPYVVYSPYKRRWYETWSASPAAPYEAPSSLGDLPALATDTIPEQPTLPESVPFAAGEQAAHDRLERFIGGRDPAIYRYAEQRDRPDLDATSHLSPYLRFGMISVRRLALAAWRALDAADSKAARKGAQTWLDELIWREFYQSILYAYPRVRITSFRPEYDKIRWRNHEDEFDGWCRGQTGYPFIDAAMRQLTTIGWMHNRARMAVASFLVKDLLIDWRWGERWFMQHLVDGDPASNNGGWQWSAGTGTDAAPYFRIFNPVSQGTKFDPNGDYVRKWVHELADVPTAFIHEPWAMDAATQKRANCTIGQDYPAPIVDHKAARERTLTAYKAATG